MLNGLIKNLKHGLLSENHWGFQANRGIVGMIFATRPAGAKHLDSYTTLVDLTKAFDTGYFDDLWTIMTKYRWPPLSSTWSDSFMIEWWHTCLTMVRYREIYWSGMKQGYVVAPTLLSMMLSAMLSYAFSQGDAGVEIICYTTDGKLYRPGGPKGNNHSQSYNHIRDPLFTDDCALNAVKHRPRLKLIFIASCGKINLAVKERRKTKNLGWHEIYVTLM